MISLKVPQYFLILSRNFDIFRYLDYPYPRSELNDHNHEEVSVDTGQWIAIGLSVLLGVWYVVGAMINRRRGIATFHWLREGLEQIGKISEAKWIGSAGSGARMTVTQAEKPYRRIETIFLLESREIMPIWLFNRIRNKQDEMILKANLRQVPSQELESAPRGNRKLKDLLAASVENRTPFELVPAPEGFDIIRRGKPDDQRLESLRGFLDKHRGVVFQYSLRRQAPHLILRVKLPSLQSSPASEFLSQLSSLLSPPQ
jgi:hypothetical protein